MGWVLSEEARRPKACGATTATPHRGVRLACRHGANCKTDLAVYFTSPYGLKAMVGAQGDGEIGTTHG